MAVQAKYQVTLDPTLTKVIGKFGKIRDFGKNSRLFVMIFVSAYTLYVCLTNDALNEQHN